MTHVTDLGFTIEDLIGAQGVGDVRMQSHPEYPNLTIWNYTEDVQYRNRWNKITLACRGLIIDIETGEVIARPWEKFFNFGQMDNRIESTAPVEVTDKVDGSLGILYQRPDVTKFDGTVLPGEWAIATRGSFASEQALHATELLNTKYEDFIVDRVGAYWLERNTYLFEIVYPSNRIVVNYGDMDDLVMLGAVDKKWGDYYGPTEAAAQLAWPGPVTEVWKYEQFVDALSAPDRAGKEGYVIRSGRNIVKLKQADYVELHRIVTNLSPKTIWEAMGAGKTVADICSEIPDEFHKYVTDIGDGLTQQASDIAHRVVTTYFGIIADIGFMMPKDSVPRKKFAEAAKKYPDIAKYLFLLFDDRDYKSQIWHHIKPRGDIKSLVEDNG